MVGPPNHRAKEDPPANLKCPLSQPVSEAMVSPVLSLLIQTLNSSRGTLPDTPRNSVPPAVWETLSWKGTTLCITKA